MPNVDLCEFGGTLYVSTITGCSPVTIGPEVVVDGDLTGTGVTTLSTTYIGGTLTAEAQIHKTGIVTTDADVSPSISKKSIWRIAQIGSSPAPGSLPNGSQGQRLTIYVYDDSLSGSTTINTWTSPYSSFTLTNAGDSIDLLWDVDAGWIITGYYGTVIA